MDGGDLYRYGGSWLVSSLFSLSLAVNVQVGSRKVSKLKMVEVGKFCVILLIYIYFTFTAKSHSLLFLFFINLFPRLFHLLPVFGPFFRSQVISIDVTNENTMVKRFFVNIAITKN